MVVVDDGDVVVYVTVLAWFPLHGDKDEDNDGTMVVTSLLLLPYDDWVLTSSVVNDGGVRDSII